MTYNRFHYNTALWNAGREEAAAIARSIIQAHTGPHVQAVIGGSGGTTLISDFIITEGTVKKPPTQYKFPDLTAAIRAFQTQAPIVDFLTVKDLAMSIRGFGFKDMPACVFIVNQTPNLPAKIFGLLEANLLATILGRLGEHDLPAIIQALVADLAAQMVGLVAPSLSAQIFVQPPGNLGARIHAPLDLPALLAPVQFGDLLGDITGFQFKDLPARMLGVPTPILSAFLRTTVGDIADLPTKTTASLFPTNLAAFLNSAIPGPFDFVGTVTGTTISGAEGSVDFIGGSITALFSGTPGELAAFIRTADTAVDLLVTVTGGGAFNIQGIIGAIPLGERDRFLNAFSQPVHPADLGAVMTLNKNVTFLGASILSLSDRGDLAARIGVAETFVTAILTISTVTSRNLRATIGVPDCAGGSANSVLGAIAVTQHARSLGAVLESFLTTNLGASINTSDLFFAYDTINIRFTPFKLPGDPLFRATDTILVVFSPFRGQNLGATINTIQNNVLLTASINPVFPLPRVVPAINRLTAADLRLGEPQNIQEIRLQLEGALLEYIYVNGTDTSFIKDFNEDWKINIRSFKPIAEGLFGDHAAAKICRLGSLTKFHTMDEAVRSCIQAVLGFESQANMGAQITSQGGFNSLAGFLEAQNTFGNLGGLVGRVFSSDFGMTIIGVGTAPPLSVVVTSGVLASMGASLVATSSGGVGLLTGTISGSSGFANQINAFLLGSTIGITEIKSMIATIDTEKNEKSLLLSGSGSDGYISVDTLANLGFGLGRQFTVSFLTRWNPTSADGEPTDSGDSPIVYDSILGASSGAPAQRVIGGGIPGWKDGFGFYWDLDGASINFWVNDFELYNAFADFNPDERIEQWVQIVGVFDADAATDNVQIYINGVSGAGADVLTANLTGTSNTLEIGRVGSDQVSAAFPDQFIDEIGVWPTVALSSSEVSVLFGSGRIHNLTVDKGAYVHADDLAVYYQFEDTTSTFPTVTNVTNNGTFDGTMVNMNVSTNLSAITVFSNNNSIDTGTTGAWTATSTDLPLAENGQGSFTIMAHVLPDLSGQNDRRILGFHHTSDTAGVIPTMRIQYSDDLSTAGQNKWQFQMNTIGDDSRTIEHSSHTVVTNGTRWYHLVGTYDFSTKLMSFYIDGALIGTATLPAARKKINEFTINKARESNAFSNFFVGRWDACAVWDRVLTATEVTEIYGDGSGTVELRQEVSSKSDLTAWYTMGEINDTNTTTEDYL